MVCWEAIRGIVHLRIPQVWGPRERPYGTRKSANCICGNSPTCDIRKWTIGGGASSHTLLVRRAAGAVPSCGYQGGTVTPRASRSAWS